MLHIKICGITTLEDAITAVEAGADLLGFNFYPPSPRFISPLDCASLISALQGRGATVITVGVFVNHPVGEILAILDECGLDLAQLSGDEPPADLSTLAGKAFKALRPDSPEALQACLQIYPPRSAAPSWLVDAHRMGAFGGTGQAADWRLASTLARQAPVLLAGGLSPENVSSAISQVRPWGVDVASGVEKSPGHKDAAKIAAFIHAARRAAQEINDEAI